MINSNAKIPYTTLLPAEDVEKLKQLATDKVINSVNSGIRAAIKLYLKEINRSIYAQKIAEAAKDHEYMARTLDTQKAYTYVDQELGGQW